MREGELASGRFYQVGDTTFYAASGRLSEGAGDVFLHQKRTKDIGRAIVASQLSNSKSDQKGQFGLLFKDVNIYEFADHQETQESQQRRSASGECLGCDRNEYLSPLKHLYFDKFYMELSNAGLVPLRKLRRPEEANFIELFSASDWDSRHDKVLGERLLRAALCLVTPLLALVAVALTYKGTLLLSLPISAGLVLLLSFFGTNNVGIISQFGSVATVTGVLGATILVAGVCIFTVQRLHGNLISSVGVNV
jgi:hypothetical protein